MVRALLFAACVSACGFSKRVAGDVSPDADLCSAPSLSCATPTVLRECRASGEAPVDTPCNWGCMAGEPARCAILVPSGGAALAMAPAAGGAGGSGAFGGSDGGPGGAMATAAGAGENDSRRAGGGGGAVGRIRINTRTSEVTFANGGFTSPALTPANRGVAATR